MSTLLLFSLLSLGNAEQLTFAQKLGRAMQTAGREMSQPQPQPQAQQESEPKRQVICTHVKQGNQVLTVCN